MIGDPPLRPPTRDPALAVSPIPFTIVCISDTHLSQPQIPDDHLLLHTGHLTNHGSFQELQSQLDWLASLPHKHRAEFRGIQPSFVGELFTLPLLIYAGHQRHLRALLGDVMLVDADGVHLQDRRAAARSTPMERVCSYRPGHA